MVHVGERVSVERGSCTGHRGTVRALCRFASRDWVGVELDAPVGRHDGRAQSGEYHFRCAAGHGIYLNAGCLKPLPEQPNGQCTGLRSDPLARLDDHVLGLCVRWLPVHPRPFAITARAGKRLQRAVEAVREELGCEACEAHGLESARGEAASLSLGTEIARGETAGALRLVVARAQLDVKNEGDCGFGLTPLMIAAIQGHTEIVTALIGAGAELDLQNEHGHNALMLATECGRSHDEIVTALVAAGSVLQLCTSDQLRRLRKNQVPRDLIF